MTKEEIFIAIKRVMVDEEAVAPNKIVLTSRLKNDLELDSLDTLNVLVQIEHDLDVTLAAKDVDKVETMQELVEFVDNQINKK